MALYKTNKRGPEDPPKKRSPYLMYNTPTATSDATSMRGTQKQALYIPISEQIAKEKARQELNKRATQNRSYIAPGKEKTDVEKQQSAEKLAALTDETNPANPNYLGAYNTRFAINPYAKGSTAALQEKQFNQNVQAAFMGAGAGKLVGVAGKAIPYLNTPLTIGSKTFPAITPANIAEVGFGVEGAKNLYPSTREFIENPSITSGLDVGMNAMLAAPLAGKVVREAKPFMQEGVNVAKNNWLKGYKEIPKPKTSSTFKSEIDWAKWNPDTPKHKVLMDEYNAIEESTKKTGTWMKNSDGSAFQGTPEQFIQQQSSWFKKAFQNGHENVYRGGDNISLDNQIHPIVFTGDINTGKHYAGGLPFSNITANPQSQGKYGRAVFDLYYPKNKSSIVIDNNYRSWREIPRKYFGDNPPLRDMHNMSGDFTSTDDIAKWMVENDKSSVRINNIFDSTDAEHVTLVNHKPGNYLKSRVGNVGFFDMTNPNIYKSALLPVGTMAGGASLYNVNK